MRGAARNVIQLGADDDVVIALRDIAAGEALVDHAGSGPQAAEAVKRGHKIAARPIEAGRPIRKMGQIIGVATASATRGAHVHAHNLAMVEAARDHAPAADAAALPPADEPRHFEGFRRADGRVGTRNYLAVLSTVNCAGSVARFIAEGAIARGLLERFPSLDGVIPIAHGTGCGLAASGEGYDILLRTLAGYARNPNVGGVLLIGLGCEVLQAPALSQARDGLPEGGFQQLTIQATGGTRRTVEAGVAALEEVAQVAAAAERSTQPASALVLGLQCGASDGYSAITANPALGAASDLLVRQGGTAILSETPEIYGAEHLLTRRAETAEIAASLLERIAWWRAYCDRNGGVLDNNPSPGNKRGGLTTILEKSLGAVAKAGAAPLSGVYRFGEPIDRRGLVFMDSPGFDPCSVTGQIASGATLIAFTTGRGSVSGFQPAPCVKLATNSEMYAQLEDDMDMDCGDIIGGDVSIEAKGSEIFERLLRVASGERTKSEDLGFGGVEFVPWQIGAVM